MSFVEHVVWDDMACPSRVRRVLSLPLGPKRSLLAQAKYDDVIVSVRPEQLVVSKSAMWIPDVLGFYSLQEEGFEPSTFEFMRRILRLFVSC